MLQSSVILYVGRHLDSWSFSSNLLLLYSVRTFVQGGSIRAASRGDPLLFSPYPRRTIVGSLFKTRLCAFATHACKTGMRASRCQDGPLKFVTLFDAELRLLRARERKRGRPASSIHRSPVPVHSWSLRMDSSYQGTAELAVPRRVVRLFVSHVNAVARFPASDSLACHFMCMGVSGMIFSSSVVLL